MSELCNKTSLQSPPVRMSALLRPSSTARLLAGVLAFAAPIGYAEVQAPDHWKMEAPVVQQPLEVIARGKASWYGPRFHGKRTASGERFDMNELTAAHPTLPFGTLVRVRNTANGREVVVRINDRLPSRHRIIDLSKAAAHTLGFLRAGLTPVVLIEH